MSHSKIELEFDKTLESTDYGLIIDKNGQLKGIWIPNTINHLTIPDAIAQLCVEQFGIDPNCDSQDAVH